MNRRSFFRSMIGGVAATAAVRTWPFRVFSFPQEVKIAPRKLIRFIRAFDPMQSKMVNRWDTIMGFSELEKLHGLMDEWNKSPLYLPRDAEMCIIGLSKPLVEELFTKEIRLKTEHGIDWTCD